MVIAADHATQHYLLGLFAVANNIPAIPLFIALCREVTPREQRKLALVATLTAFITMIVAMLSGAAILAFFEISIPAFRIAGGILLMITGMQMVRSQPHDTANAPKRAFSQIISVAVVPIAIPLTTGAGTISTVILFANGIHGAGLFERLLPAILIMTLIIYLSFRYSTHILTYLGATGMDVVNKVFGLITLALGVQFALTGLAETFPKWV
jgi:multiple antibiotic resistance protein